MPESDVETTRDHWIAECHVCNEMREFTNSTAAHMWRAQHEALGHRYTFSYERRSK